MRVSKHPFPEPPSLSQPVKSGNKGECYFDEHFKISCLRGKCTGIAHALVEISSAGVPPASGGRGLGLNERI